MGKLRSRLLAALAVGVVLGGVAGTMVTLLMTIEVVTALAIVVVGAVVWVTVVIGLRNARRTHTPYW